MPARTDPPSTSRVSTRAAPSSTTISRCGQNLAGTGVVLDEPSNKMTMKTGHTGLLGAERAINRAWRVYYGMGQR